MAPAPRTRTIIEQRREQIFPTLSDLDVDSGTSSWGSGGGSLGLMVLRAVDTTRAGPTSRKGGRAT